MRTESYVKLQKPSFWYRYLPFKPKEKRKFLIFCFFKALLSFMFVLLRIQKKANIVIGEGAEKIPATKTIVFFLSLLVATLYSTMSNRYRQEKLFYGILLAFLASFLLYGLVLAPYEEVLRPAHAARWLERYKDSEFFNDWLKTFVVLYFNWTKVFFYCMAELWGQFVIVLFFWGLASEYFSRKEAKRFFHFFIASGNLASLFAAWVVGLLSNILKHKHLAKREELLTSSRWVSLIGAFVVILLLVCYRWVNSNLYDSEEKVKIKEMKTKLSFVESIKYVFSNPYFIAVTLMVISCGVCRSLVETTAEKYIKIASKSQASNYVQLIKWQVVLVHLLSIFSAFFIVPSLLRRRGWKVLAYMTPLLELCVGAGFFLMSIWYKVGEGSHFLMPIAYFAIFQGAIGTFSKYIFFDTSKETVYTGLDPESRRKGKAADVVGSRMGKWLASWIHIAVMGIFSATEDVRKVTPVLLTIFLGMIFVWLRSVRYLGKRVI